MVGRHLDIALDRGYFRMHQYVFTCQYLMLDDTVCPVHWLRVDLRRVQFGKSQRQLINRNKAFSVSVTPLVLTHELTDLYARYRASIDFDAPESIEASLFDGAPTDSSAFDTYVMTVRDGDRLIAAGIFDRGMRTIAGIMNVYDPDYKRYSLGKYLMLLKINFAQQQRLDYYYPGYVVSYYPKFDYKIAAAESATEVLDTTNDRWLPFSWETVKELAQELMRED
ncbi:GNAT family N-acetyltransferase [Fibrella aquatilis]|uniref:GNAT family N-acetyltransferase n=1 Tax=Fibrella aquatilis TaxID=2817059 RepID=A0A939G5G5_9BACT|nr:GNAT family N-acetyltransferase [Fibrella aquatilis]MBO0932494.1 GNAT family N-acetyltransferase [Fibrella aquatilis]